MQTVAVLPVKRFAAAKQRLGEVLPSGSRRALAEAMYTDVLTGLRRVAALDAVLVVTADPVAQRIAEERDAIALDDPAESGQNQATARGIAHALELGAAQVLCVSGDCPMLDPAELDTLLGKPRTAQRFALLVPDRHGTGTNALLLAPPDVLGADGTQYGPDSFPRHQALVRESGLAVEVAELESLALDVDTPEDFVALHERIAARRGGAAHTRGMLHQLQRTSAVDR